MALLVFLVLSGLAGGWFVNAQKWGFSRPLVGRVRPGLHNLVVAVLVCLVVGELLALGLGGPLAWLIVTFGTPAVLFALGKWVLNPRPRRVTLS